MDIVKYLQEAVEYRSVLLDNESTDCFRLFNAAGDGLDGLSIDRYGEYLLVQFFLDHLFEHRDRIVSDIIKAAKMLPFEVKGIVLKNRMKVKDVRDVAGIRKSLVVYGEAPPKLYSVSQNGIKAFIDLMEGQSTGIFLDMREVRDELLPFYQNGGLLLNLFCYTAVFSIHALMNGMEYAVNVDLSKAVLNKARENYQLNNLRVDNRDFIYGDSMQWVCRLGKAHNKFSIVIIDPPTFSRNKKKTFSVKKDYARSLAEIRSVVDNGYVLTAINSSFVSEQEYRSYHPSDWELEFYKNESFDFRSIYNPYLKVGLWRLD